MNLQRVKTSPAGILRERPLRTTSGHVSILRSRWTTECHEGSRDFLQGGHLFRIQLTGNRRMAAVDDPRLEDRVADNVHKWEITESESLLFGRNFGIATDIHTGPDGHLYVVSLTRGAVYEIFRPR